LLLLKTRTGGGEGNGKSSLHDFSAATGTETFNINADFRTEAVAEGGCLVQVNNTAVVLL
jgi:hypothetical protein